MPDPYLTFQKFNDAALANEIALRLQQNNIPIKLEDNRQFFDPSFAYNNVEPDISLKLKPEDFSKAHEALEEFYKKQLDDVDKDYYLFGFTDQELIDIVTKPDEWGHFDYQLAQKILNERGKEIKPEVIELLKKQRIKDLTKPEPVHKYWIYGGYFFSIFGSIFGFIIGATLAYFKKTLPNGERIYVYCDEDRNHGIRMLFIAAASLVVVVIIRFIYINEYY